MLTVKKRIINFQTVGSILYRYRLGHKLVSEMMLNVQSKSEILKNQKSPIKKGVKKVDFQGLYYKI